VNEEGLSWFFRKTVAVSVGRPRILKGAAAAPKGMQVDGSGANLTVAAQTPRGACSTVRSTDSCRFLHRQASMVRLTWEARA